MDDDLGVPIREVLQSIATADVVSLYFPALRKTLLFDARYDDIEGPMVRVVDMVNSTEERFRSMRRMRPRFARPEAIVLIPWTRHVDSLSRLGVLQEMMDRCRRAGSDAAVNACREAYRNLQALELEEKRAVIRGDGYQTIWSAPGFAAGGDASA